MNFLEQLAAEWFTLNGYFVRTNLKFGKRAKGGWAGEMDIAAFDPVSRELVHMETSMDADRWDERSERLTRKFDEAGKHYKELFHFHISGVQRIAVVGFSLAPSQARLRDDIELKTCPQLVKEIGEKLLQRHPLKQAVPETLPILRAVQFAVHWGPQAQVFQSRYRLLAKP